MPRFDGRLPRQVPCDGRRKDLIAKIESKLEYAASELSGLESDSGPGDVDDALGYVREVESYVDQLARVKGSDSTANNMASYYPGYIRDFRGAAEELKRLENKQRDAEEVLRSCKAFDAEMTAKARAEVEQRWTTIGKMTQSLRAKNHPAVKFLAEEGDRQHLDRQRSSSTCTVYEVGIGSNIIDCARASDCTVVELKPDNARSIAKGRGQAISARDALNGDPSERAKLTAKNSAFGSCRSYAWEVQCYKLCPEIDPETNEMKSISATWRTCAP